MFWYLHACGHGMAQSGLVYVGLEGLPVFGNAPRMMREIKSQQGGEDNWLNKLHSQFGPIYKLKMFGKFSLYCGMSTTFEGAGLPTLIVFL